MNANASVNASINASINAGPRPRLIVIGGGFAGLCATRALAGAALDITLIDRANHHLFQPLRSGSPRTSSS